MLKPRLIASKPVRTDTIHSFARVCPTPLASSDLPELDPEQSAPWALGYLETDSGRVLRAASRPRLSDWIDLLRSRLLRHRERIRVSPGLYALGSPSALSPVLVTANYKPSFDSVRFAMDAHSAWVLALDTKGVNVWCAAGKGSFGDDELLSRIRIVRLATIAPKAPLILPQLGSVGVSAWAIARKTRRTVHIGPIYARDLPAFISAGFVATPAQRRIEFGLAARAILIPRELVSHAPLFVLSLVPAVVLGWPSDMAQASISFHRIATSALRWWLAPCGGLISGLILVPLLLPYLPGRAFSLKGAFVGLAWGLGWFLALAQSTLGGALGLLSSTLLSSWLAALFTGSSPYTSLSGVQKELRIAIPVYLTLAGLFGAGFVIKAVSLLSGGLL